MKMFMRFLLMRNLQRKDECGINHKERREHKKRKGNVMFDVKALSDTVREIAFDIHVYHGHGHLEMRN